jgi:hypothetical protein
MKKAIIGALLSGLIFPGLGQVYLRKKKLGLSLILSASVGLAGVVWSVLHRLPLIMEKIQPELEKGSVDFNRLMELSARYSDVGRNPLLDRLSLTLLIGSWLFAVGHALYAGRQLAAPTGE